ncbi:MAG: adenylate/guanylate cyclase domain-containing protein [Proteobacteria bacterium]|nr:adenylate/guanylate cyclase domain-containing protein [Pseudomonadota bacterium]
MRAWLDERTLRLAAGSVLFAFATTHFFNAGMGIFGVAVADQVRMVIGGFWGMLIPSIVLYVSFTIHIVLALRRFARRRTWRMPIVEAVQTGFGLLIPLLLIRHIAANKAVEKLAHIDATYARAYQSLWPDLALDQSTLLLMVWIHGCIGLTMALRPKPWFRKQRLPLLAFAVAVPLFGLCGFVAGGREARARPPVLTADAALSADAAYRLSTGIAYPAFYFILAAIAALILFRALHTLRARRLTIRYVDGPTLRVPTGPTLLEISRRNGLPHASVCGGKARCSTCRVRVVEGLESQPAPEQAERRLLAKIRAPETVRLACQLHPTGDITVQRLVDAGTVRERDDAFAQDPFHWGVERTITVMFADIRGFTTISERNFLFDVVFVLNRFQADMSAAIEKNGGRIDKYLGDGLMAIFGVDGLADGGARQALAAARDMEVAVEKLNHEFNALLGATLRIGIGLHRGPALMGRIGGSPGRAALTALGDTVNTAARLEEMTKTFSVFCVASNDCTDAAGFDVSGAVAHHVAVRGREAGLTVWAINSFRSGTS